MGIYYKIVCDEVKEEIDPGKIDNLGIKLRAISAPGHPFARIAIFAMSTRWLGMLCRVLDDLNNNELFYGWKVIRIDEFTTKEIPCEYKDITEQMIKEYNEVYKTSYQFSNEDSVDEKKKPDTELLILHKALECLKELVFRREEACKKLGANPDGSDGRYAKARAVINEHNKLFTLGTFQKGHPLAKVSNRKST